MIVVPDRGKLVYELLVGLGFGLLKQNLTLEVLKLLPNGVFLVHLQVDACLSEHRGVGIKLESVHVPQILDWLKEVIGSQARPVEGLICRVHSAT